MQVTEKTSSSFSWRSLLQLGFSGIAILGLWGVALYMLILGLYQVIAGGSLQGIDPSGFLLAGSLAWIGLLIVPSAWFALLKLANRVPRVPAGLTWDNVRGVIWLMVPVVLAGYGAAITPAIAWLVLPPLNVLAISIPVVWYLSLGGRGLRSSSPQSAWGVLGAGLVLGPGIILGLELVGAGVAVGVLVLWLAPLPGFMDELQRLIQLLETTVTLDPIMFLPFVEKYLMRQSVLTGGLLFIAGFVPLLEEFFKPIGLWLMNKQTLTPARGFLAGMLSGAAFGLFESLLQGVSGEEWVILALARGGTSLIHIFNSGLVGWGFALAWERRSVWPWLTRYLVAVLIHGLWNGHTVLMALAFTPDQTLVGEVWGGIGLGVLGTLGVGCFVALLVINRRLQREAFSLPPSEETVHTASSLPPSPEEQSR
ncbi:MAG: PrsW family intramembrane metalloprotease [Anaerolineales bacterium]|nr:PrsW family intramembrane metalloprotease [Anaerolineales bacterium]